MSGGQTYCILFMHLCSVFFSIEDMLPWSDTNTSVTDKFMDDIVAVLKNFVHQTYDRSTKVIDFKSQNDILKEIDVEIEEHSSELSDLISTTKKILDFSVKTGKMIVRECNIVKKLNYKKFVF